MKIHDIELTNFIDLTDDQKLMILEWRNNESIRRWMYGSDVISKKDHFDFFDHLKSSKNKKYFLLSKNMEDIGVIYFTDIEEDKTYFGLYANPNVKIAGIGRILEAVSIDYAFDILKINTLKLEVFFDNKQVINLHKKYKFKVTNEKFVNNRKVVCMELKNENR